MSTHDNNDDEGRDREREKDADDDDSDDGDVKHWNDNVRDAEDVGDQ